MEMHTQQTLLNRTEQLKELEKRLGAEHAKALLATLEQQQQAEKTWPVSPPVSNGSNSDTGLGSSQDAHKMQGLFTSLLHHGHSPSALTPGSQVEAGGSDLEIEDEDEEEIEVGEAEDEADVSKDMDEDMQELLQEAADKAAAAQAEAAAEDSCKDQLKATTSQTTSSLAQGSEISA